MLFIKALNASFTSYYMSVNYPEPAFGGRRTALVPIAVIGISISCCH